jgi:FixJ family two-component response regulator
VNPSTIFKPVVTFYTLFVKNTFVSRVSLLSVTTEGATTRVAANKLISVIDDDQSMCRMLARGIRAAGFDVAIFNSAEEFLASGRCDDSACAILDVDLPGMNGLALQKRLNESTPGLPIIFISGHADETTGNQALRAGAIGFFHKPFSLHSLLAVICSTHSGKFDSIHA